MANLAELAAYTGSRIYLLQHPENRSPFLQARELLDRLIEAGDWNPASLHYALSALPIRELQSQEATIIVGATTILWDQYLREMVQFDKEATIAPVIRSIRAGLDRALQETAPPSVGTGIGGWQPTRLVREKAYWMEIKFTSEEVRP